MKEQSKMEPSPPKAALVYISVKDIVCEANVRSGMNEDLLFQLAGSMKAVGLLEPVLVHKAGKGKFTMIAGHRRLKAALQNGDDLIEAKVYDTLDVKTVVRMQLAENLQDEALNHIDIARKLGEARDAGMTNAEIAADINKSDDYVRKHLDLLRLAYPVAELVASGRLPVKQAELIARVGDPKKQIDLTEQTTRMSWDPGVNSWRVRISYQTMSPQGDPDQTLDGRDYVAPMKELRDRVAVAMLGLAACGWPMGEKFAGKRACDNCPDNTATYQDQPALFAGINPRGSAKKGHCTNEACYKAKTVEQNIVREDRRKEAEKKTAAKIAKAKKAGLSVCEGCTKVSEPDELTEDRGRMLCKKCIEKRQKKAERDSHEHGGGETYQARQKRVQALEKKFPWDAEQKFAVALHGYGTDLARAINEYLKGCGDFDAPPDAERIILLAAVSGQSICIVDRDELKFMPLPRWLFDGGRFTSKALAMIWRDVVWTEENPPNIDYTGEVRNVPLPEEHVEYIESLEDLAKHWKVKDLPDRPTAEDIEHAEIIKTILKGKRNDAVAAIAACEDTGLLEYLLLPKAVNNIAKIATWRVKAIVARVEQLKGKADPASSADDSAVASPKPASEQLGHIDKDTPLGRQFEFANEDAPCLTLALIKRTKKDFVFISGEGKKITLGIEQWEMRWSPNCIGHLDPQQGDHGIISDGDKELALIHIAVADLKTLKHADQVGLKGDWRRAAVRTQIEKLEKAAADGEENN